MGGRAFESGRVWLVAASCLLPVFTCCPHRFSLIACFVSYRHDKLRPLPETFTLALPWPYDSGGPVAKSSSAQAPCGGGEGLQRPPAGDAAPRQHAQASHAVPCPCRPSPSLRCAGDQRPHRPAAAAARQPQCLPAPGHRHEQAAGRHPAPNGSDVRSGRGALADAHPQCSATHTGHTSLGCLMRLWLSSCCLLKGWKAWVEKSAGHAPCGGIQVGSSEPGSHVLVGRGEEGLVWGDPGPRAVACPL
eukprot:353939-Chlamydomonas_euryale.AAC.28